VALTVGPAGTMPAMSRDRDLLLGTLSAVVAASLFGMLGPLSRFGAEAGVAGVAFTAWRALLGVAFLAVLITVRGAARTSVGAVRGLSGRGRLALITAAVMGVTLNVAVFTAFGLIPIALALMLFYLYPAGVVVVDLVLGRERMTPPRLVALLLSFGGVALVLFGGMGASSGAPLSGLGIVLGLAGAASQVVFITVSRGGYSAVPADAATLVILATSVVGASTIAVIVGQGDDLLAPLGSPEAWPALLVAGVAAAGVSSLLVLTAIRKIGGTRTGILMLLEPVVGVVLAALWLGEALLPVQVAGGALVLAGALVLQLRSAPDLEPIAETATGPVV
jgi:drug/metabolite transporter (DMT)-like permease